MLSFGSYVVSGGFNIALRHRFPECRGDLFRAYCRLATAKHE
jgi:hypothetical protein